MNRAAWLLALAPIATGCLAQGDDDLDGEGAFSISVSAADTALVLDLVNYPGIDHAALDDAAALDVRAADAILAHRDGTDGIATTSDDNRFDSLAELDAVKWVGDAALTRLIAFAKVHPVPSSVTIEGVTFQGWHTEAIVWGVSQATVAELDRGLDSRAATNLVANAPYTSLDQIGLVPYVGPTVLEGLRATAPLWWREMHEPQAPCTVTLGPRPDQTASDFSLLLELATTGDWPFASVSAAALPDCVDPGTSPEHAQLVTAALLAQATGEWGWTVTSPGGMQPGGIRFTELVEEARDRIAERAEDGSWTPADEAEQALLAALPAMSNALLHGPATNPADYVEVRMWLDAEECSQYGSALIQRSTHRIWIVHQFPRC